MTLTASEPIDVAPVDEWRRLDRRMLLVHPVVELGRALPALIVLLFAGSGGGHGSTWSLVGAGVVLVSATLRWFTTRYRITSSQVQLRHGLLRRRLVVAPLDRVRTVDVTAHALHRALGLARVVIGTGTSDRRGRPALTLDGLTIGQAGLLRAELLHRVSPAAHISAPDDRAETEQELLHLEPRWIGYAPFTLSGAVTALAVAGFAWRIQNETRTDISRFGPLHDVVVHLRSIPLWRATTEVTGSAIAFVAVASTVGYLLAFWNFRLTRHSGGTLHVTRGLITSRATSIEERRIRGVEMSEPLLLRAVGGARTIAIATGLRVGRGAERGGTMLVPPAPRASAQRVAVDVVGSAEPIIGSLSGHGPRAGRRRLTRALGGALLVVALLGSLRWITGWDASSGWWWVISVAAVPLSVPLAVDRARSLGHALVGGFVVTRFGSLVRRRAVLSTDAVIGWNVRSSLFQRRAGLVTLTATTAAGRQGYRLTDVPIDDAIAFADAAVPGLLRDLRS